MSTITCSKYHVIISWSYMGTFYWGQYQRRLGTFSSNSRPFKKNKKAVLFCICRNLQSNGLTGKLPPELGNLKYLKELHIDRNRLQGSLLAASYPSKVTSFQGNCMQNKDLKHRPSSSSQCAKVRYAMESRFLVVSGNIYAFGVLLLEIVSGRPPFCKDRGFLTEWLKHFNQEELETVCEAARQCLDRDPNNNSNNNKKPSVEELCEMLECEISLSISAELRSSSLAWAELALDS
uniref:Protein kinase domain-containing protein n=1 Tax=Brassica campestris TaxID=3711 RepID=M4FIL4_BRACM